MNKAEMIAGQMVAGASIANIWGELLFNVKDIAYGAKANGLDDAAAIQKAINAAAVTGGVVVFPPGTYVTGNFTVPSNVTLSFTNGAKLSINTGATVTINGPIDAGLYQIFSGTGAVTGSMKVDRIPVSWFGAKSDGVTDDSVAVQKAINIATINHRQVHIPYNTIYTLGSITIPKGVLFWDESIGNIQYDDLNATDNRTSMIIKKDSYQVGGVPGNTYSALAVYDTARDGYTAYEWGILSVMNNFSSAGENVALYAQGNQYGTGPTWGATIAANDMRNANAASGLIGLELDIFANAGDPSNLRSALDIVVGKQIPGGSLPAIGYGIRITPVNGDSTQGKFKTGLFMRGSVDNGIDINSTGTTGIKITGSNVTGIDLSAGTYTGVGIRMKDGLAYSFDAVETVKMVLDAAGNRIQFYKSGLKCGYIDLTAADHAL